MSTDVLAIGTYYHQTPVGGSSATAWINAGPRKGTTGVYKEIGYILFDKTVLASTINGANLPAAKLVLNRDTAYGTGTVDICIAPAFTTDPPQGEMTYEACMANMTMRHAHHLTTVTGSTCSIDLPGYFLSLLRWNTICGFIVYQEDGEGTSDIARFTMYGKLELTLGATYETPVWTRPIGAGDVICNEKCSHVADLWEILHYVCHRESAELTPIEPWTDFEGIDIGAFEDWAAAVRRLQGAIDTIYTAEGKDAITWLTATDGMMPNAAIINQLRNALEASMSSGSESLEVSIYGRATLALDHSWTNGDNDDDVTWAKAGPHCGYNWEWVHVGGNLKQKQYNYRFGFWVLSNLIAGKTISSLKLRITKTGGNNGNVKLYGVKINSQPSAQMSVSDVIDTDVECASFTMNVGETKTITLSDTVKNLLVNGDIYGVGFYKDGELGTFSASATLVINES